MAQKLSHLFKDKMLESPIYQKLDLRPASQIFDIYKQVNNNQQINSLPHQEKPPARRIPFTGIKGSVTGRAQVQNLFVALTRPTY